MSADLFSFSPFTHLFFLFPPIPRLLWIGILPWDPSPFALFVFQPNGGGWRCWSWGLVPIVAIYLSLCVCRVYCLFLFYFLFCLDLCVFHMLLFFFLFLYINYGAPWAFFSFLFFFHSMFSNMALFLVCCSFSSFASSCFFVWCLCSLLLVFFFSFLFCSVLCTPWFWKLNFKSIIPTLCNDDKHCL